MKLTLSVIKADIGSIGGHIRPSARLLESVQEHIRAQGKDRKRPAAPPQQKQDLR
ncbi:MAG: fructose 1,6-bisphosphatase [Thiobacillus sp.]|jgi:fructose 1,6-bisphosphate aldolase/phosphatase